MLMSKGGFYFGTKKLIYGDVHLVVIYGFMLLLVVCLFILLWLPCLVLCVCTHRAKPTISLSTVAFSLEG